MLLTIVLGSGESGELSLFVTPFLSHRSRATAPGGRVSLAGGPAASGQRGRGSSSHPWSWVRAKEREAPGLSKAVRKDVLGLNL